MTATFPLGLGLLGLGLLWVGLTQRQLWHKLLGSGVGLAVTGVAVFLVLSGAAPAPGLPQLSGGLNSSVGSSSTEPGITLVLKDDPDILKADKQARKTLPTFIDALAKPQGRLGLGFKYGVPTSGETEFMWFDNVSYLNGKFTGDLANEPEWASMQYGDRLTVDAKDVVDWKYVEGGVMQGAYSIRVFRSRMKPAERAAFDLDVGATFKD
jgi:uncharacterized protein YegJ (DUF2314 family)